MPLATVVDAEEVHLGPDVVLQDTLVLLAMPLHEQLELSATARVSVAPYTTDEDLDALFDGLRDARKIFAR